LISQICATRGGAGRWNYLALGMSLHQSGPGETHWRLAR
jgi:hypothetical protein